MWIVRNLIKCKKHYTHTPELRARCHREQAHHEHPSLSYANGLLNITHEDDNYIEVENDNNDNKPDKCQNPSMPQCDTNCSAPEDIQYHPIINSTCIICMSLHKCQLFCRLLLWCSWQLFASRSSATTLAGALSLWLLSIQLTRVFSPGRLTLQVHSNVSW